MASRFEIVDEEYIEEWKDGSENENTKNRKDYWKNVFKVDEWKKVQANLEEYESDVLHQTPSQLYAFRNSVILSSMLLTSNRKRSS